MHREGLKGLLGTIIIIIHHTACMHSDKHNRQRYITPEERRPEGLFDTTLYHV